MKNYTKEAQIAKAGLLGFCAKISKGLGRVGEKLVTEIMYGIAARNSCQLTEIARALEEDIPVIKTVYPGDKDGRSAFQGITTV